MITIFGNPSHFTHVKGQLAKKGYHVEIDEIEAAVRELAMIGE